MKKLLLLLGILLIVIISAVYGNGLNKTKDENNFTVYLANSQMNGLVAEEINLESDKIDEKVYEIFDVLKKGSNEKKATIPQKVLLNNVKIDGRNVVMTLNEHYKTLSSVEEIISRASIVKSVTGLPEVDTVEFYIGTIPYKNANGMVFGAMTNEKVVLDLSSDMESTSTKKVTLYFSDEQAMYLVPVEYEININSDEQIEKVVLDLLIKGPKDSSLKATIPPETKIKNIYTNEGVCYVDFSEEFITNHTGGSTGEVMTIYSIVNTLTGINNITKVQFLVEGTVREEYKGHLDFNVLFQQNFDLIKK